MVKKKPSKKFDFRSGSRVVGDPQAIGEELEQIRKEQGKLTAEAAVKSARPESSPSHGNYEWDDKKGAHKFRLVQARTLIRAVVVVENSTASQQYVHVRPVSLPNQGFGIEPADRAGRYEPMTVVVQDVDMFQTALEELERILSSAVRAVQELKAAADKSKHKGKLAMISIVVKALETASSVAKQLAS